MSQPPTKASTPVIIGTVFILLPFIASTSFIKFSILTSYLPHFLSWLTPALSNISHSMSATFCAILIDLQFLIWWLRVLEQALARRVGSTPTVLLLDSLVALRGSDLIIHAGDVGTPQIIGEATEPVHHRPALSNFGKVPSI